MRRPFLSAVVLGVLSLAVLAAVGGCQKVRKMLPASTIDNPTAGDPEFVVRQVLEAAMDPDEKSGWAKFEPLLHTSQKDQGSLSSWRSMNFSTARRKWPLFVVNAAGESCSKAQCDPKATPPTYKLAYTENDKDDEKKLFIVNAGNPDNPTPCKMKLDPQQGNAWRITICSL